MDKLKKIEEYCIKFMQKNSMEIILVSCIIISLLIRCKFLLFESDDYITFLSKWFEKIKNSGGIFALKDYIGDYNTPYIFIMAIITYLPVNQLVALKVVSICFDYLMAFTSMMLIYQLFNNSKNKQLYGMIVFVIVSMLPTVILNSSMWGQCDSIYTTFVLLAILNILKEKNIRAFVYLGIAFSFKMQTIFVLPVFILIYLSKRNFSILNFFIIPIMNIVLSLPAILVGKPIKDCFLVYFNQTKEFQHFIVMNFPNIYSLFFKTINENYNLIESVNPDVSSMGIYTVILSFIVIAIIVINKKIKFDKNLIIKMSLWSVMFSTFLLPRMHDRYLFIADVLSVIYAMINPKKYYIAILVNLVSLYTYIVYTYFTVVVPVYYFTVVFGIALVILTKDIVINIKENEKKEIIEK